MRVMISIILMVIAAVVGFFFGAGMNEAMGGAILLSMAHVRLRLRGKEEAETGRHRPL